MLMYIAQNVAQLRCVKYDFRHNYISIFVGWDFINLYNQFHLDISRYILRLGVYSEQMWRCFDVYSMISMLALLKYQKDVILLNFVLSQILTKLCLELSVLLLFRIKCSK